MNAVHLTGAISSYGVRLSYSEAAKPQCTFTVILEEPGKDGTSFKTFVPVLIVGPQAEDFAATLEPGELIAVSGKLAYKSGKTKDAGKLMVVCYGVERLATSPVPVASAN